jgi:methionyl-tRNA formyltransferase
VLKIWRARVVDAEGTPGTIVDDQHRLLIACGQDGLEIGELQRAGGKRMSTAEFLRGRR